MSAPNFITMLPEKGCELRDVSFFELESETKGGGWVIVHCYETEWSCKANYRETEGKGMRYVIARVDSAPELDKLQKSLSEEYSTRCKSDAATAAMKKERDQYAEELFQARRRIESLEGDNVAPEAAE